MIERVSAGEVLGELREALYMLEQMPAGSRIGPPWDEEQQSVEEATAEMRQKVRQQELLVAVYGSNFVDTTCADDFVERHGEDYYSLPDSDPGPIGGFGG